MLNNFHQHPNKCYIFQLSKDYTHYLDLLTKKELNLIDCSSIKKFRKNAEKQIIALNKNHNFSYSKALHQLYKLPAANNFSIDHNYSMFFSQDKNGSSTDVLNKDDHINLQASIKFFNPWKIGPWNLFNYKIDSEWDCRIRWKVFIELLPWLKDLSSKKVIDIGTNNGHMLFYLLNNNPRIALGFEPVLKHYFTFHIFQNYLKSNILHYESMGYQHLKFFNRFFDLITLCGVLYHHPDPIDILRKCHQALASKGKLVVDCEGIPGDQSIAIFPEKKYGGGSGYWWLPTKHCLINWVKRSGFRNIEIFFEKTLTKKERKTSQNAQIKSLDDFIDKKDSSLTIEGYPRSIRYYLLAEK